jgi:acyl-coenzyme A synthetase/AMP-(fatty) acid ligase
MFSSEWYRTGDIGFLDDNGFLIIVDRIKDVIKYKGFVSLISSCLNANHAIERFQVSPTEIEEIVGLHPQVQDVGVTSTWDQSQATEVPRAFVIPTQSTKASDHARIAKEIQALVADKAAGYKKLRGGVKFVDSLPKNPTGKLLRRKLREIDQELGSGRILSKL